MKQNIYEKLERTSNAMGRCDHDQPIDLPHILAVKAASSIIDDAAALAVEVISVYETTKSNEPTGHLWPDPNHVVRAKDLLERITVGGGLNRNGV